MPRPMTRLFAAVGVLVTAVALCLPALAASSPVAGPLSRELRVPVRAEPDGSAVEIDATLHLPGTPGRHPAVLMTHGFGGSKDDVADRARALASDGYAVLAWSARGFGESGGRIHLNDPAFEIADAKALVDLLAKEPTVLLDAPGDPRVGVAGASYGGAVALMLAGSDPRVDAVTAAITWHDLADSLFPQSAVTEAGDPATPAEITPTATPGPFKQLWASRFFGTAVAGARGGPSPAPGAAPADPLCGRFDPTVCRLLRDAAETGSPSSELITLLRAHSPKPLLPKATAPTLLIQGMADSLFGIDQADANARGLAAAGAPVAMRWMDGGHDGPSTTTAADDAALTTWFDRHLRGRQVDVPAFTYAGVLPRRAEVAPLFTLDAYPGLGGAAPTRWMEVPLSRVGRTDRMLTPPGGQPASIITPPGLGGLASAGAEQAESGPGGGVASGLANLPTYPLAALPGQSVSFDTGVVPRAAPQVVGSPRVRLRVTSTGREATFFVGLWQVQAGVPSQSRRLVAPVRMATAPGQAREVTVALPAAMWSMPAGSEWRVLVTSTDSAHATPRTARADQVEVVGGLHVPVADGAPLATPGERDTESIAVGAALGVALLVIGALALLGRRRRTRLASRPDLADVPLVVTDLVKTYADGHRAVDDVSWRAEKGQVVGLLGPNGAGKTTTIRMVLGLISPDSGSVHVLGDPVTAGSPVLGRVGALVEGPGFLPHLTGRQNLQAYWRATGRPTEEAGFEEALAVAALGGALDRPVRTYSHGMKQRLGIAQAMLGLPELLILDEPTNGLDPPQIAAMRPILHAYAAAGRTVVISSHLLAEVEQTCSHVVVMHAGRVVTSGAVADLVASADTTVVELGPQGPPPHDVAAAVRRESGIQAVDVEDDGAHGRLTVVADRPRVEIVRAVLDAGADVVGVGSRRHLEEVFLGVIAEAQHVDVADATGSGGSLVERLRQVRAR